MKLGYVETVSSEGSMFEALSQTRTASRPVSPTQFMQQRRITIKNRLGLHARAAARLVRLANSFHSETSLARYDSRERKTDARSVLGVLLLAAVQHTELELVTEGEDEVAAMEALCRLIEEKFGEAE